MHLATVLLALGLQDDDAVRAAVTRAIPLLEKGAAGHVEHRSCFSCHNQGVPVLALTVARKSGFVIDEKALADQVKFTADSLARGKTAYREGKGQGGAAATASYGLWTLDAAGWKPDETTAAVAGYLLGLDKEKDHWRAPSNRPPQEASLFTSTAFSILSLQSYGSSEAAKARIEKARAWLASTKAKDTEDRVFRLWGLKYAGGDAKEAVQELVATQREDGGWSQTAELESDAYATGSALYALHEAGDLPPKDDVYRRGMKYLLSTQTEDGSWHVKTRSKPIQKYFESGFPHGKDQFISISATAWSVAALASAAVR